MTGLHQPPTECQTGGGLLQVVGGTDPDYQLCVWRPYEDAIFPSDGAHFDMGRPIKLKGHSGPISALSLDSTWVLAP